MLNYGETVGFITVLFQPLFIGTLRSRIQVPIFLVHILLNRDFVPDRLSLEMNSPDSLNAIK